MDAMTSSQIYNSFSPPLHPMSIHPYSQYTFQSPYQQQITSHFFGLDPLDNSQHQSGFSNNNSSSVGYDSMLRIQQQQQQQQPQSHNPLSQFQQSLHSFSSHQTDMLNLTSGSRKEQLSANSSTNPSTSQAAQDGAPITLPTKDKESEADRYLQYKTNLCRAFEVGQRCHYGQGCLFAHGPSELRTIEMNAADGIRSHRDVIMFRVRKTNQGDSTNGPHTTPSVSNDSFAQLQQLQLAGAAGTSSAPAAIGTPMGTDMLSMEQLAEKNKSLLFKTNLCRSFGEACPFGNDCLFAHNEAELRTVEMNVADKLFTHRDLQLFKQAHGIGSATGGGTIINQPTTTQQQQNTNMVNPMTSAVSAGINNNNNNMVPSVRDAFGSNNDISAALQQSGNSATAFLFNPQLTMSAQAQLSSETQHGSGSARSPSSRANNVVETYSSPLSAPLASQDATPLSQMNSLVDGGKINTPPHKAQQRAPAADGSAFADSNNISQPPAAGHSNSSATQQQQQPPEKAYLQFRTNHCRSYRKGEVCPYGLKCFFAHGDAEIRTVAMNAADGLYTKQAVDALRAKLLQSNPRVGAHLHQQTHQPSVVSPQIQQQQSLFGQPSGGHQQAFVLGGGPYYPPQVMHQQGPNGVVGFQAPTQTMLQQQHPTGPQSAPSLGVWPSASAGQQGGGHQAQLQNEANSLYQQHQQQQLAHFQYLNQGHYGPIQPSHPQQQQQQVPYVIFTPQQLQQLQQHQQLQTSMAGGVPMAGHNHNNNTSSYTSAGTQSIYTTPLMGQQDPGAISYQQMRL